MCVSVYGCMSESGYGSTLGGVYVQEFELHIDFLMLQACLELHRTTHRNEYD